MTARGAGGGRIGRPKGTPTSLMRVTEAEKAFILAMRSKTVRRGVSVTKTPSASVSVTETPSMSRVSVTKTPRVALPPAVLPHASRDPNRCPKCGWVLNEGRCLNKGCGWRRAS